MSFFSSDEEDEVQNTPVNKQGDDKIFLSNPYDEQFAKTTKLINDSFVKLSVYQHELQYKVKGPLKKQIDIVDPSFEDNLGLFNLIQCPDKDTQNVLVTFAYLDHEVNKMVLKFENKYLNPLMTYGLRKEGDEDPSDAISSSGLKEIGISQMLPLFKEIFDLLKRTSLIMINIVNQLHGLYFNKEKFYKETYKHFELFSALDTLGKACSLIYTIDLVLLENVAIKEDFNRFKNTVRNMYKDPSRFGVTETQLKKLEKQLSRYERTILSGACFTGTTSQTFDQKPDFHFTTNASNKSVKDNSELYNLFNSYFKANLTRANDIVASPTETIERKTLFHLFCLYALYRKLFPQNEDRNLWKQFWSVQKKVPIIIVGPHLVFNIPEYMKNIVQLSRKALSKDPRDPDAYAEEYIDKKDDDFEKEMSDYYSQFVIWATQIDSHVGKSSSLADQRTLSQIYQKKIKLLLTGYILANHIKNNVVTLVFLHVKKGFALTSSLVKDIATGCMLLKAIKYLIDENQEGFPAYYLAKFSTNKIMETFQQFQERTKKIKKPVKEFVSALYILENLFEGPFSATRKAAENTCFSFLNNKKDKVAKDIELEDLKYFMWRTQFLANYQLIFKEVTDCTFLYWIKDLVPLFFSHIGNNPIEMKRLKFLTSALQDCEVQLKSTLHLEDKLELFESYKQELVDSIQESLIKKICQEVDDHLRLLMHTILIEKLKGRNPFEMPLKPIHQYLMNGPIDVFGVIIDPIEQVSKHLNETFYNLNVLNLHDYETYEGLRNLAKELFGVDLLNAYLPSQSLEKGNVDILNIMRSIGNFVNHFNYSLFTQTFIESKKDSTILNTISIRQIADSVQTHGVGILNTSANLVYQFILKKFNTFSQFLYDEMVQTPLRRELRTFRENKEQWEGRYPFARAELVAKEIKRLGLFEDNKTFLDKFRILITTIGNALGFVRLLRSASLSYLSKQIEFLPFNISFEDAELNENFYLELTKAANFSGVSCGAANQLDDVIKTLKVSFSQRTDYLRILAKAFDGMLAGQETKHLRMFYFLIPALTLNYVEAMVNAKERIVKKRAADTYIFDDGFVLGIVYFLRVLGQNNKFDSLHWFEEVKKKCEKDLGGIRERESDNKKHKKGPVLEEETDINFLMSAQKTTQFLEEFTYFQHSFNTAKVLLKEMSSDTS